MMSSTHSPPITLVSNSCSQMVRRSANYHPSPWGDKFLDYKYDKMVLDASTHQVEELKQVVKTILIGGCNEPSLSNMKLIDTLQRLGVAYHFQEEIGMALDQMFNKDSFYDYDDLQTTALHFRLLRQHGYNAPCGVFSKYKDSNGSFKASLTNDVSGMLALYEAAHFRVHGEEILDDALGFTSSHLMSLVKNYTSSLEKQVKHTLRHPLRKNMPRLEARHFITVYEQDPNHDKLLLQLAKLDFNILQSLHLKELSELSKWWKGLQFASKLPFARDRLVECYFWILGVYFEPNYSLARSFLTKVIAIVSTMDDIYDIYGTLEELNLFTNAIERWDMSATDMLPEYMKVCYGALLDVYDEIARKGTFYCLKYSKEAMKDLAKAYLKEANWFNEGYIPTMDEYMKNALISCGYPMLTVTSFGGMGDIVPKEAFHWVKNDIIPVKASAVICRLMDDMVSHEFEKERGDVASAVECYMKEYNVSEKEALNEFNRRVDEAWKDLNQGCLKPTVVPMHLLERIINLSRMMDVIYKHDDGYTNSESSLKDFISSLFVSSIPI